LADEEWVDVYAFDDLWEGELVAVDVGGVPVLLANLDGTLVAYDNRCPHQASPLHEGELDGEMLVCARHLWCFDITTGKGINPDNATLIPYQAKVEDKRILVRRPT
jgi:toluene monooxygenase system ferredoxin subunit